jgi:hypothetical protein
MKKFLLITLAFIIACNGMASDFSAVCSTGQTLYYTITSAENKTVEVVPQYPNPNFYDIFPTGVLSIPDNVIFNTINYKVTSIGAEAFYSCNKLIGSLSIPGSVTSIDSGAFSGCIELTAYIVDPGNKKYSSSDGIIYNLLKDTLVACPDGKTGSLTIPSSVTTIGNYSFSGCSGLTGSLNIPGSVVSIGNSAFSECKGLTGSLTIPGSVTSIGNSAFSECTGFTGSMTLPNLVTSIGDWAFYGCSGLSGNLIIPGSVASIGNSAFRYCTGFIGSLTIPNSVTSIEGAAFSGCSKLTAFIVEPGNKRYSSSNGLIYSLHQDTIVACPGISTGILTIPGSVTTIGNNAFSDCKGLSGSIIIPSSVKSIGNFAFTDCIGFNGSLIIPASVNFIGKFAFINCSGLTSIYAYPIIPVNLDTDIFYTWVFEGIDKTKCTLYVPDGSKSSYQAADQWKDFVNIVEMTTAVPGINNTAVKIYPNPVTEYFQIEGIEGTAKLILSDLNGKMLLQKQIVNNEKIAAKNIGSGSYIVKIITSQGTINTKLVKK